MRKVMVWGFVLVAAAVIFTGVQAQRTAPAPSAPTVKPTQVEVTNFPVVQNVGGSVNVGNLPVDGDGNVRVAAITMGTPYRWIRVATALPVTYQFGGVTEPVDVAGWRHADFLLRANDTIQVVPFIEYGADGIFGAGIAGTTFQSPGTVSSEVHGPQVRVRFQAQYDVTVDVWLYLSN